MLSFLKFFYILLFIILLIGTLLKKRNVSFMLIYLLSSGLFYFNAFEGYIFEGAINKVGVESYPIYYGTYIVLIINLIALSIVMIAEPRTIEYREKTVANGEKTAAKIYILMVFALCIYMLFRFVFNMEGTFDKHAMSAATGSLGSHYKYLASWAFVYIFTCENVRYSLVWKILATIPIFSTFLFGNRSYLVISVVAVFFNVVRKQCERQGQGLFKYLYKHKKMIILAFLLLLVTLVIKGVYNALFKFDFELVFKRLTSIDYYKQVFFVSEPNTIAMNLDTIVKNSFQLQRSSYIGLWAIVIPFIADDIINNLVGGKKFSLLFQEELYVGITNRGSTYLGEAYSNGGYMSVFIVVLIYTFLLLLIFKGFSKCSSNISKCTLLLMGIDGAFYVQRNSMDFELGRMRFYIYIAILLFFMIGALGKRHKIKL